MTYPAVTAFYAAVFALLYVGLSSWVVAGRLSADVLHGDGGNQTLEKRIRAQAISGNTCHWRSSSLLCWKRRAAAQVWCAAS